MKSKEKHKKEERDINAVKIFRKIKEKISTDLFGKSNEEIKEYLKKNSLKLNIQYSVSFIFY